MRRNNYPGSNLPVLRNRRNTLDERYNRRRNDDNRDADYEDDWDIYESEIRSSGRLAPSSPSRRNDYGRYHNDVHQVRGLRSGYTSGNDPDEDEEYDYTYDPEYNERDEDYEYANEHRHPRHTQTYRDDDGRWEYGASARSLRHGLNRGYRSRFYNGLSTGYEY